MTRSCKQLFYTPLLSFSNDTRNEPLLDILINVLYISQYTQEINKHTEQVKTNMYTICKEKENWCIYKAM